jgi:hypothetical protein
VGGTLLEGGCRQTASRHIVRRRKKRRDTVKATFDFPAMPKRLANANFFNMPDIFLDQRSMNS